MNSVIRNFIAKGLFKKKGVIANKKSVDFSANALEQRLKNAGVNPNDIKSENELNQILSFVKQAEDAAFDQRYRVIAADTLEGRKITDKLFGKKGEVVDMAGKKMDTSQGIIGGKSVAELMKSGQVTKGARGMKKSKKVENREMFESANQRLNKTDVNKIIADIKAMNPMDSMKEANSVISRKGIYKNLTPEESKKILQDTEDHIFERNIIPDPEDMADGGVAGLLGERTGYEGGLRADAPNPRILELMLNEKMSYEDALKEFEMREKQRPYIEERMGTGPGPILEAASGGIARTPFAMGKRAFLKFLASGAAGITGLKSGIFGFGKGGAKKAVTETVKQTAGPGTPPPYFLNLVKKIKTLGDDTIATKDKAIAKKYKDYTMEEDFAGNIEIIKKGDDVAEDVFMSYKIDDVPVKGKKGSTKVEEYEEFTARPDREGKMKDIEQGVPDEVVQEGTVFEDTLSEFGKADGGRIGYNKGKFVKGIISLFKKKPKKLETIEEFLEKRQFMKDIVGNTEKNKNARQLAEIKAAAEEARKNPGFKFKDVDIDKDIRPILDRGLAEALKKNRKLNADGGLANMLGE